MTDEPAGTPDPDRAAPVLVLLHGLGATSAVWDGWRDWLDAEWPGRWLAPDLPGHGGAAPLPSYSFGALAAAIAAEVRREHDRRTPVAVLGHSLGGVIALALGSGWFGVEVATAIGLGIKVDWTADELARARALAQRPPASFPTRQAAIERHLKVSGLVGLVATDSRAAQSGVVADADGWRLALDARAFAVGAPDLERMLRACRADVVLARGEHDPMVSTARLEELVGARAVTLPGLGHCAHVEDPSAVQQLVPLE